MIYARTSPFDQDYVTCNAPLKSVRELIGCDSDAYAVTIDGEVIQPSEWGTRHPKPDSIVWITPVPQEDLGSVLSLIATIALFAVAGPAGGFLSSTFGGSATIWEGVVFGIGALAVNALFPPPVPKPQSSETRRELKAIAGAQNRFPNYDVVPEVAGRHRVFPPYAAKPYTEIVGDDQYFNALFCVGLGEYQISSEKIGENLLTNYDGVTLEQTLDPNWVIISEDQFDISLDDPADPSSPTTSATRTTAPDVEEISVDFIAPAGLIYTRRDGTRNNVAIDFRVEYRAVGTTPWLNAINANVGGKDWIGTTYGDNEINGNSGQPLPDHVGPLGVSPFNSNDFRVREKTINAVRFGLKWPVSEGQYEVRVTRTRLENNGNALSDETLSQRETVLARYLQIFKWTVLRSHNTDTQAVQLGETATFLKLRIKADDQLNGIIDRFSVLAERMLRTWDGTQFTGVTVTRNPAWWCLHVLTGQGNAKAIPNTEIASRVFLDEFRSWALTCDSENRFYDRIVESQTSVYEELVRAAGVGRAVPVLRDAKHTIVQEEDGSISRGIISTRNSRNFRSTKVFITQPHAFRVRFLSEDADYEEDEIIVYDDGFDANNAAVFETLRLEGITDPDLAWKFGRYHIAQIRLRPERFTCEMDFEHLSFIRGDRLLLQNDAILINLGSARIVKKVGSIITLDNKFPISAGTNIAVNIRTIQSGNQSIHRSTVTYVPGTEVNQFTLDTDSSFISEGNLLTVGVDGQDVIPVKVLGIEPQQNLTARVHFVDAAPEILTADTGTIPAYNPNITEQRQPQDVVPPAPRINSVRSDGNLRNIIASGERTTRLIISVSLPTFQGLGVESIQARIRKKPETGEDSTWITLPPVGSRSGSISTTEVDIDETYEIQVRSISFFGVPSAWSAVTEHQVLAPILAPPEIDALTVTGGRNAFLVNVDLTSADIKDASQVQITYSEVNDRDDASAITIAKAIPQDLTAINSQDFRINFAGDETRYFWARLADKYQNFSDWTPSDANSGIQATSLLVLDNLSSSPSDGSVFYDATTQPETENRELVAEVTFQPADFQQYKVLLTWAINCQVSNKTSDGGAAGFAYARLTYLAGTTELLTRQLSLEGYLTADDSFGNFSGSKIVSAGTTTGTGALVTARLELFRIFTTSGTAPSQTIYWDNANLEMSPIPE